MKKKFKKLIHSLRFNVSIKLLLIILVLSFLLLIFIPMGLENFFLEESYRTIEKTQQGQISNDQEMMPVDRMEVNHIPLVLTGDNIILPPNFKQVDKEFLKKALNQTLDQRYYSKRYLYESDTTTIYYVIKKDGDYAAISYVYASYVNYYIQTLYQQLLVIIGIVVLLSLVVAAFLSNNITKPLISISKKIKNIEKNNWDDEIQVTRKDEIGDIQYALEEMRVHLLSQDKSQREMFQNISHDLKTPIMIIEGYSQSILDGYVKDEEQREYVASIMEEAKRLEHKVKSLLLINKIDQMTLRNRTFQPFEVDHLIETVMLPFEKQFPEIQFKMNIESSTPLNGEFEEWRVALENIIDNMTRFAKSEISVTYKAERIELFNDGEPINDDTMKQLFLPYGVGTKSNFGLGLSITHKIINMFGYEIKASNVSDGVLFEIYKKIEK